MFVFQTNPVGVDLFSYVNNFFVPPNLHKSWLKLKRSGLMFPRFMAQKFTVYWSWLASIKYSVQSACFNIRAYSNSLKPKDHKRILP